MENKIFNKVLEELKSNGDLLFTEVERIFNEEHFEYEGNKCLLHPNNENLVIWINWNDNAINILDRLLKETDTVISQCNTIEFLMYSIMIDLPIAKSDKYHYKHAHWFPAKLKWIEK